MRRFSIRSVMSFVIVSALGLAALRNADELWAGMVLLFAMGSVGVAVLGAVFLRGRERAWWAGFAFFAGGTWRSPSIPGLVTPSYPSSARRNSFATLTSD
jgi:hypothetical protein